MTKQHVFAVRPGFSFRWPAFKHKDKQPRVARDLSEAKVNREYLIEGVVSDDKQIVQFLFTLGCFQGETITLISVLSDNYTIAVKDARYSIDIDLAKAIKLSAATV
ncbi:FeoA family protein [Reinekea marinisedimentorum]|uniref:Ferrous iron transport protein A n=1 Tax=Reinekea marinisedimentorum TaxID=230495 RepID=A0A4R3IAR7_9GAMM|nr:FeoA family protein [Reinekea marinisedimentorum]TCS43679.1 ferrous iron transport protein A [Reinekea marinisedimentorum]